MQQKLNRILVEITAETDAGKLQIFPNEKANRL